MVPHCVWGPPVAGALQSVVPSKLAQKTCPPPSTIGPTSPEERVTGVPPDLGTRWMAGAVSAYRSSDQYTASASTAIHVGAAVLPVTSVVRAFVCRSSATMLPSGDPSSDPWFAQ